MLARDLKCRDLKCLMNPGVCWGSCGGAINGSRGGRDGGLVSIAGREPEVAELVPALEPRAGNGRGRLVCVKNNHRERLRGERKPRSPLPWS